MAKVKNYEILLNNGREIVTLAIVSSKGLAFQTKKRLNTYSKAEYYASK